MQTYTIEEILEWNEVTVEDAVYYMVQQQFIELPTPEPIDFDD